MEIISSEFILFVCGVVAAYHLTGYVCPKYQWLSVLAANILFCLIAGGTYTLLYVLLCAIPTWLASHLFAKIDDKSKRARKETNNRIQRKAIKKIYSRKKRSILIVSLIIPMSILVYHKYWNTLLFNFGMAESPTSLNILLPLGISFYTFQSLSYLIDTYNNKYAPEPNFLLYLTFVCYFPSFIQGPINHYDIIVPQFSNTHYANINEMQRGLLRIGLGLFKKIAIANMLASNVSAITSNAGQTMPGLAAALGVVLYSLQMYGDFSGGIDVVEGVSELLGVKMQQNFKQPYLSTSLSDFWRRWHMSLGVFMRDYVFYPLAVTKAFQHFGKWSSVHLGKYAGRTLPACIANIIVFLLVGLWHGAEWHYVAWGLYNGLIVALADLCQPFFSRMNGVLKINPQGRPHHIIAIIRTFIIVNIGRYFDCIVDVGNALSSLANIAIYPYPSFGLRTYLSILGVSDARSYGMPVITFIAICILFVIDLAEEQHIDVRCWILSKRFIIRLIIYMFFIIIIAFTFSTTISGGASFMYANF